jgi:hypothetical protein
VFKTSGFITFGFPINIFHVLLPSPFVLQALPVSYLGECKGFKYESNFCNVLHSTVPQNISYKQRQEYMICYQVDLCDMQQTRRDVLHGETCIT